MTERNPKSVNSLLLTANLPSDTWDRLRPRVFDIMEGAGFSQESLELSETRNLDATTCCRFDLLDDLPLDLPYDLALDSLLSAYEPVLCDLMAVDPGTDWTLSALLGVHGFVAFTVASPRVPASLSALANFRFEYFIFHSGTGNDGAACSMDVQMRSKASLRIGSDDLVPERITQTLGSSPTEARTKGEVRWSKTGREWVVPRGYWSLKATEREPEDLDAQIAEIFDRINPDPQAWAALTREHKIDLFCGLFMAKENEGVTLSPKALMTLASRGVPLALDIYEAHDPESKLSVDLLDDRATKLSLHVLGMALGPWRGIHYSDEQRRATRTWRNAAAPADAGTLLTFSQKCLDWLPDTSGYLVAFDNSNSFDGAQMLIVETILGRGVRDAVKSGSLFVERRGDESKIMLAHVIMFVLMFGGHVYIVSSDEHGGPILNLSDGYAYFIGTERLEGEIDGFVEALLNDATPEWVASYAAAFQQGA